MECAEIRKIIPQYFRHTASEEEITLVEEHLCVCHDCRTVLGELMDKASSTEEAVETPSQEQPEPLTDDKPQEDAEQKKEEEVPAPEAEEIEEKPLEQSPEGRPGEVPAGQSLPEREPSEREEDVEYFPGGNLEASMDKVDDILGKTEPAKGDPGDKPEEVEPIDQDKEEEKAELPREEEKIEEKTELPLEEEKAEETTEKKEEVKEKEEVSEPSSGTGIELKEEEPVVEFKKAPILREEGKSFLAEEEERKEEVSYTLDKAPLGKSEAGLLEYFCLIGGLAILGFLAYLLLKG